MLISLNKEKGINGKMYVQDIGRLSMAYRWQERQILIWKQPRHRDRQDHGVSHRTF